MRGIAVHVSVLYPVPPRAESLTFEVSLSLLTLYSWHLVVRGEDHIKHPVLPRTALTTKAVLAQDVSGKVGSPAAGREVA